MSELKLRPPEKQEGACIRKRRECGRYEISAYRHSGDDTATEQQEPARRRRYDATGEIAGWRIRWTAELTRPPE
jgi:hypothetical protein